VKSIGWESILPLVEFSYNSSFNRAIQTSSLKVVYEVKPPGILDLNSLPLPQRVHSKAVKMVKFM
jgi:hypothetical protein